LHFSWLAARITVMPRVSQKHKSIRHYHNPGDLHELTFSCFHRMPLLTNDPWCELLAESIDKALDEHALRLSAFVFMPEHVHLLVWPIDPSEARISDFLKTAKLSFSTKIKHQLVLARSPLIDRLTVVERPGKSVFRFWQAGPGYDRNLDRVETVLASIDYCHMNSVKRGLCNRAIDWRWSSARFYYPTAGLPGVSSPRLTRLPAEFLSG
jgi:putative transposase